MNGSKHIPRQSLLFVDRLGRVQKKKHAQPLLRNEAKICERG